MPKINLTKVVEKSGSDLKELPEILVRVDFFLAFGYPYFLL